MTGVGSACSSHGGFADALNEAAPLWGLFIEPAATSQQDISKSLYLNFGTAGGGKPQ
jgi:hypothetical protein